MNYGSYVGIMIERKKKKKKERKRGKRKEKNRIGTNES